MTSFVRADCPSQSKSPLLYHLFLQLDNFSSSADSSQLNTALDGQQAIIMRMNGEGEGASSHYNNLSVTNNNINNK